MWYNLIHKEERKDEYILNMKIGIDARFFGPEEKGLGRYTQELVLHLQDIDHENEYICFLQKRDYATVTFRNPRFHKVLADFRWYTVAEQMKMPKLIRASGVQAMLYPHYNVPLLNPVPYIVTIHDLIIHHFPTRRASMLGPFKLAVKMAGYHLTISRAVKRAKHVLAVSNYTKEDIVKTFGISPAKVSVTYEAAERTKEKPTHTLEDYCIVKPYFLYVGNAYPHKNLETLIHAFQTFRQTHPEYHLVLVGRKEYFYERLERETGEEHSVDNVIFAGFVPDGDLSLVYENATSYVFPSKYEGFGLPPLEAMLYNVPVVSSNASCLPEILGDAAILFNSEDPADIVRSLNEISENPDRREELIQKGRAQVSKYRWDRMAQETYDVIQKTFHA